MTVGWLWILMLLALVPQQHALPAGNAETPIEVKEEATGLEDMTFSSDEFWNILDEDIVNGNEGGQPITILDPDGTHLRLYTLPVGQGSAHIIQCPNGELTVFDMGKSTAIGKHWCHRHIKTFLSDQITRVTKIVISHNHEDHTNLLPKTFDIMADIPNLADVYISCTRSDYDNCLGKWFDQITIKTPTRAVIHEFPERPCSPCGPTIDICSPANEGHFQGEIIFGNAECGVPKKENRQSLVMKIYHIKSGQPDPDPVTILLPGDYDWHEDDHFPTNKLRSTAYVLSHHGSPNGNQAAFTTHINPQVMFVSADPYFTYGHPDCDVIYGLSETACPYYNPQQCPPVAPPAYTCTKKAAKESLPRVYIDLIPDDEAHFGTIYGDDLIRYVLGFQTDGMTWSAGHNQDTTTRTDECANEEELCKDEDD